MPNTPLVPRIHKRYKVHDKVIALSFEDFCEIHDISVEGAAIKWIGKNDAPLSWILDFIMLEGKFHATIPVNMVWTKNVKFSPSSSAFITYVGVLFANLTPNNQSKVEY